MEALYKLPYDKFQHLTVTRSPGQVAEWLAA
jgi:hypothetical protein